jgi:two-component sensor histidine kinase
MSRLAELDLPDRLAPFVPRWVTEIGFGLFCCGVGLVVRISLDLFTPGAAPFALLYPTVALATLFGRWRAGAVAAIITTTYAWTYLYPVRGGAGLANLAVIALSSAMLILVSEIFRRAASRAAAERDRQIAERDLFLAEFDHRVKNNFAVVASLLDLQRRRAVEPGTQEALGAALSRVESIARAHRHLYRGGGSAGSVEMKDYLPDLCAALADALFLHGTITLQCTTDSVQMPRDRAVSIGLVVNELVTNAVKHAFTGRDRGTIRVSFREEAQGWRLAVADDGVGMNERKRRSPDGGRDGGLGQRLIDAFARQADGTITVDSDKTGTRITLDLAG